MPFEPQECFVGMMAYFSVNLLRRNRRIRTTNPTRDSKPRPFVCYAEHAGEWYWTCLTGTPKPHRRTLSRKWVRCLGEQSSFSGTGDLIVADERNAWVGPAEAFAACSHKYDQYKGILRPMVIAEGVQELQWRVKNKRGLLPPVISDPARLRQAA